MKLLLGTIAAICCFTACHYTNTDTYMPTSNRQVIDLYFSHFNEHQWEKMAELYADTAAFKDPSLGNGIVKQTTRQIVEKYSAMQRTFPDLHDRVIEIYPSGNNHIIVEFVSTGTAPDGSRFELPICTIFTIEHGVITKDFTYYDNFGEEAPSGQP